MLSLKQENLKMTKNLYYNKNTVPMKHDFIKKIGEGVQGSVYETKDGDVVKYFKYKRDQSMFREIAVLSSLQHPNIVKMKNYKHMGERGILILEKADNDLSKNIYDINKKQRPYIIWQLLNAISYIHSFNISHRDIKPENILVFNKHDIKICDFGLAKPETLYGKTHTKEVVSLWYRSPEVILEDGIYDYSVDVWSVGVIMLELILKDKFPLKTNTEIELLLKIFNLIGTPTEKTYKGFSKTKYWNKYYPVFKGNIDNLLSKKDVTEQEVDLLKKLLSWKTTRISALDALKHPYFNNIYDEMVNKYSIEENEIDIDNFENQEIEYYDNFYNYKTILFCWLWEVSNEYEMCNSTLLTAYHLFIIYSYRNKIVTNNLQLVGISCLLIANNLLETETINEIISAKLTDNTYTSDEIYKTFICIFKYFNFKLIKYICNVDNTLFNLLCCIISIEQTHIWNYEKNIELAKMIINGVKTKEIIEIIENIKTMGNKKMINTTLEELGI